MFADQYDDCGVDGGRAEEDYTLVSLACSNTVIIKAKLGGVNFLLHDFIELK
jgi:hypothetical protein